MTKERAKRLYEMESKWTCGGGELGRKGGSTRRNRKARSHATRIQKLAKLAGAK